MPEMVAFPGRSRLPSGLLCLALVVACGHAAGPEGPVALEDLAGVWDYSETIGDGHGMSCKSTGALTIAASDSGFTGEIDQSGTCTMTGISGTFRHVRESGLDSVSAGKVSGRSLSFRALRCQFEGSVSGVPPSGLSGMVSCLIAAGGGDQTFLGSWQATR
ncbi:MAG TPA: hypothetical protein VJL31_12375 [Gemmatimonadales bacterium]|nr:hypothetical protein [Gemmatimonadales bacterium]